MTYCAAKYLGQIGCGCVACDSARREQVKAFAARKFEELEWMERLREAKLRELESRVTMRPPCLPEREQIAIDWYQEIAA